MTESTETKTRRIRRSRLEVLEDAVTAARKSVDRLFNIVERKKAAYDAAEIRHYAAVDALNEATRALEEHKARPAPARRAKKLDETDPDAVTAEIARLTALRESMEEDE